MFDVNSKVCLLLGRLGKGMEGSTGLLQEWQDKEKNEEILVTEENLFSNYPIGFFQLDSAHINKQNRIRKSAKSKSIYQVLKNESDRNSFKFVC